MLFSQLAAEQNIVLGKNKVAGLDCEKLLYLEFKYVLQPWKFNVSCSCSCKILTLKQARKYFDLKKQKTKLWLAPFHFEACNAEHIHSTKTKLPMTSFKALKLL